MEREGNIDMSSVVAICELLGTQLVTVLVASVPGRHFLRDFLRVCVLYEIFLVRKFMFL